MATTPIKATRQCPYEISWESVTPTRAALWIKNTKETEYSQRSLAESAMLKYAHEMTEGSWFEASGDTILIATYNGQEVILNGQHRCNAIVKSGVALNTLVLRNVPLEAFKHVDQGKERTLKDVMDAAKFQNSQDLKTTVMNLWKESITGSPLANPASEERLSAGAIFDWAQENHPNLEQWYGLVCKKVRKAARATKVPAGTLAYYYLQWRQYDPTEAAEWIDYMVDPVLNPAPCSILALAVDLHKQVKTETIMTTGGTVGQWADITLLTHQVLTLAWNLCHEGSNIRTRKGFESKLKSLGTSLPSLYQEPSQAA